MTNSVVSVVVPVYNIADLVGRCVDSLLNQTYESLEVLLVDDGSSDGSERLCDEFAARDPRVRALHKPNGGISDARNHGISHATGEYVCCIDGDDYVSRDFVANLLRPFETENVDMSVVGFQKVPANAPEPETGAAGAPEFRLLDSNEALLALFYQNGLTTSAWGKLYRRELFGGIEYPVGSIQEELPVTYRLVDRSRAVALVDSQDYFYVQHPKSLTATSNFRSRTKAIDFAQEAVDFAEGRSPELAAAARTRLFMECVYLLSQVGTAAELKEVPEAVGKAVRENRSVVVRSNAPRSQKLLALASFGGTRVLWRAMRTYTALSNRRFRG